MAAVGVSSSALKMACEMAELSLIVNSAKYVIGEKTRPVVNAFIYDDAENTIAEPGFPASGFYHIASTMSPSSIDLLGASNGAAPHSIKIASKRLYFSFLLKRISYRLPALLK